MEALKIHRRNCLSILLIAVSFFVSISHATRLLAQNPNSATTTTGQVLTVNITSPLDDATFTGPPPCSVSVEGLVTLSSLQTTQINLLYVIDLSGSTGDPTNLPPIDVNGDGVIDENDDFNNDGFIGDVLDAEIGAALALNASILDLENVNVGIVAYASNASGADVNPESGIQLFTASPAFDGNNNGIPDIEEVLRSLDSDPRFGGFIGLFTPIGQNTLGNSTNFEAALQTLISIFASQPEGEQNIAFFLSDGMNTDGGPIEDEISEAADLGITINAIGITTESDPDDLSAIAEGTGGTFIQVDDPNDLPEAIVTVRPVNIASVSVNGVSVELSPVGTFTSDLILDAGTQTIAATAQSDDNTTVTATISATCQDTTFLCSLEIISPEENALISGDSVTVTAVTTVTGGTPPITSDCNVNGFPAQLSNDTLRITIPLADNNLIVAQCIFTDAENRQRVCTDSVQVQRPQELLCETTITSPVDGQFVCEDSISVTGVTSITGGVPPYSISCDINGVAATISNSTFIAKIPLTEGENAILVTCVVEDSLGMQATCLDSARVVRAEAPTCSLSIVSPNDGEVVCSDSVEITAITQISGTLSRDVSCDINGIAATRMDSILTAMVPLISEENMIVATCTVIDSCGNETVCQDSIRVLRPPAPVCTLEILSPPDSSIIDQDSVNVAGVIRISGGSPPFDIQIDVNGFFAEVVDSTFTATVPCFPGINNFIATSTVIDSCGNQISCSDTIAIECRPETIDFLFGVDEDERSFVRVDMSEANPKVERLGYVVFEDERIPEMEAMAWDATSQSFLIISNRRGGRLFKINSNDIPTAPDSVEILGELIGTTGSTHIDGIAIHPATGELFGTDTETGLLLKIDKTTAAVTPIGQLGFGNVEGLAFTRDSEPVLYGVDNDSRKLITIDITTGAGTAVSSDKVGFRNVETIVFAPDGTLLGFSDASVDRFITIDPNTGIGAELSIAEANGRDIEGLAFATPDTLLGTGSVEHDELTTTLRNDQIVQPKEFALAQNFPNPFNPTTRIRFDIPETMAGGVQVQLRIYNLLGKFVQTIVDEHKSPGSFLVEWNGRDQNGEPVSSGIYIYQLTAGEFHQTRRMLLLK